MGLRPARRGGDRSSFSEGPEAVLELCPTPQGVSTVLHRGQAARGGHGACLGAGGPDLHRGSREPTCSRVQTRPQHGSCPHSGDPGGPFLQPGSYRPLGLLLRPSQGPLLTHRETAGQTPTRGTCRGEVERPLLTELRVRAHRGAPWPLSPRSLLSLNTASRWPRPNCAARARTTALHQGLSVAKWDGASQETPQSVTLCQAPLSTTVR